MKIVTNIDELSGEATMRIGQKKVERGYYATISADREASPVYILGEVKPLMFINGEESFSIKLTRKAKNGLA